MLSGKDCPKCGEPTHIVGTRAIIVCLNKACKYRQGDSITVEDAIRLGHIRRLKKLKELKAPEVFIEREEAQILTPKVKGLEMYGPLEIKSVVVKQGARAGRYIVYITDGGPIAMFSGRYGRWLTTFQGSVELRS